MYTICMYLNGRTFIGNQFSTLQEAEDICDNLNNILYKAGFGDASVLNDQHYFVRLPDSHDHD